MRRNKQKETTRSLRPTANVKQHDVSDHTVFINKNAEMTNIKTWLQTKSEQRLTMIHWSTVLVPSKTLRVHLSVHTVLSEARFNGILLFETYPNLVPYGCMSTKCILEGFCNRPFFFATKTSTNRQSFN